MISSTPQGPSTGDAVRCFWVSPRRSENDFVDERTAGDYPEPECVLEKVLRGFTPHSRQQTSNMRETNMSQAGVEDQNVDFHPYVSLNSISFWALGAQWKCQLVKAMMPQLVKKDALLIAISQFSTVTPPAVGWPDG
ncbi:unnamed protein product [Aspergillus oryzae var. brunneus]|uniref:Unnamed protein product n=1 Tax=Aspergillus oryzae var. brunneus TaxID=332754 RepID=A0ABQ6LD35_ASPOZ|nr:unnamed protein product [Aspergillus oryzae var. brunneus]